MKFKAFWFAGLMLAATAVQVQAGPLFINNGFEAAVPTAPGWVEVNPFFGSMNPTTFWGAFATPAYEGVNAYWMGATDTGFTSSISQSVGGFTPGASYLLTFQMEAEHDSGDGRPGSFALLTLTGADVASAAFSVIEPPGTSSIIADNPWHLQTLAFKALAATVDFTIAGDPSSGDRGGSWEFLLDDFQLAEVNAVPEPASIAMFGLGGIALVVGAYRRRRAATV